MTVPHRISAPDGCVLVTEVSGHGSVVVLLHAGGPDRHSLDPFARRLAGRHTVVQPDIRGYGGSVCRDPARHTWDQYAVDVLTVLDGLAEAGVVAANVGVVVAGVGLGSTIALRLAIARPDRVAAVVALGVEDIEDDEAKAAEIAYFDAFADRVRDEGLAAAWAPIVARLPPVVEAMVTDAIRRSDPASIAAAASIARDRSFRHVDDLAAVRVPALVFAGTDWRHPRALAAAAARVMPAATMAMAEIGPAVRTGKELADALMPELLDFLDGPAAVPDARTTTARPAEATRRLA
ncbi:alpha/beta hydrolase fold [Parafrankia sp. EAN1pec]|uniref:alpha/beta fold hydrolase n=1 Tax=Parafrankia sp. (strain EAN1pec) TaxID=298653 RepID=UPI00015D9E67|nr:alpha/beta hydrolase fold [Frankia sp. EAN1pec]